MRAKAKQEPTGGFSPHESLPKPQLVLDLCAGTGCVGIALAKEIGCNVIAVEKSKEALSYLQQNVALNHVENQVKIIHGDILDCDLIKTIVNCRFAGSRCELSIVHCPSIVINPPYLSKAEMQTLQKEVTHEPETALYGGGDGLDFYRAFFNLWKNQLKQARMFACEVGDGQSKQVCRFMEEIGLSPKIIKDFNGIARVCYSV